MPKKTIRDITIKKRPSSKTSESTRTSVTSKKTVPVRHQSVQSAVGEKKTKKAQPTGFTHSYKEHHSRGSSVVFWVILFVIVGGLIAWTFMGSARIEIVSEFAQVQGEVTVTAYKQAVDDDFEYEIITLKEVLSQPVTAGEAEFVEEKAQGTIVVYNEESSSQRLIEETRFETTEGLIYKIAKGKAITIPAASGDTPGSLEVVVYADEPGEEYNTELADFVIPGWRETGSSKFDTQYARSKTAMVGGFSGVRRVIDDTDKESAQETLNNMLKDRLVKEAPAQIPEAFVFFPKLSSVSFTSLPTSDDEDNDKVIIKEEGALYGLLFHRAELSQILAEEIVEGYAGEPILVTNFEDVSINIVTPAVVSESDTSVQFTIAGIFDFQWQVDTELIETTAVGILKKNFNTSMSAFVGIQKASLKMYPVWLRSIPEKVKVEVLELGV